MQNTNPTSERSFDLEAYYDEKIAPLVTQIIELCNAVDMPHLITFQLTGSQTNDPLFCTSYNLTAGSCNVLADAANIVEGRHIEISVVNVTSDGATPQELQAMIQRMLARTERKLD